MHICKNDIPGNIHSWKIRTTMYTYIPLCTPCAWTTLHIQNFGVIIMVKKRSDCTPIVLQILYGVSKPVTNYVQMRVPGASSFSDTPNVFSWLNKHIKTKKNNKKNSS